MSVRVIHLRHGVLILEWESLRVRRVHTMSGGVVPAYTLRRPKV